MTVKLAINGFGRIGRLVLRALIEGDFPDVEIVSINSPGATNIMAHLLQFDSTHGNLPQAPQHGEDWMDVGFGKIAITHERDPSALPHAAHGVDVVLECSGKFNSHGKASAHLTAGAKKVLV